MNERPATLYLVVIISLALIGVGTLLGGIYLTAIDKSLPGELIAIGSSSAGALAGLLAKNPYGNEDRRDAGQTDLSTVLVFLVGLLIGVLLCKTGVL